MIQRLIAAAVLLFAAVSCFAITGKDIKGVYVTAWQKGAFTQKEIDATLNAAQRMGAKDIFLQVRKYDDALYNSTMVRKPKEISPDFDPLAYALKKAKPMGLRIHAWLVICRIEGANYKKSLSDEKQSWLAKMENGAAMSDNSVYLDPANPMARGYLCSVVKDLLKHYKVDGIHWDYIRYAKADYSYSDYSKSVYSRMYNSHNYKSARYDDFRRRQMNSLVRQLHDAVRSVNKTVAISASTITWGSCKSYETTAAYSSVFQDYRTWIKSGWIDFAMPMLYKRESVAGQKADYRTWLAAFDKQGSKAQIAPSVSCQMNSPAETVTQLKLAKQAGRGWCIFAFNDNELREPLIKAVTNSGL